MIIPEHNAAFIHNPKTAGKSVEHMLLSHLLGKETKGPIGDLSAEVKRKYRLESPPRRHSPASVYDQSYKFSIVRNPFDRFISAYYWWSRVTPYKLKRPTFDKFLKYAEQRLKQKEPESWRKDPAWFHVQPQVYYIDDSIDDILRFETIDKDIEKVRSKLNITTTLGVHNKSTNIPKSRITLYSKETIAVVAEWYKEDLKQFKYNIP